MNRILEINNLRTFFETPAGLVKAVDGVDLTLQKGESLAVVGESGCGKTVLGLSIMRLVPVPPGKYVSGSIMFQGKDLTRVDEKTMQTLRGDRITMIFQEPMTSLNPVFRVGEQVAEVIRRHQHLSHRLAMERVAELFSKVGIPAAEDRLQAYPHQLSGGLRQRVMIAMAIACKPELIIADEPTTALDVTIQAQILSLLEELKEEMGTSIILITHDLGVVAQMARTVVVMYAGKVVEYAGVDVLFNQPEHPYTKGLIASIPRITDDRHKPLQTIPGHVPSLYNLPRGCSFQERCPEVMPICREKEPQLIANRNGAMVRCWKHV